MTEFFVILGHFLHFDPSNNPKNQNFEKLKKMPADIIILHLCTLQMTIIWCMIPEIYNMEQDRQKFFSFWTIFCPFTTLLTLKLKFGKNLKKTGDIILLHMCSYEDHIICSSWNIRHDRQGFLSFWAVFPLWPS